MSNKVKFGLKNVHYAVITETDGVVTYGTPVAIPGAVSLVQNPKGDATEFYADDDLYFGATANQGYSGTLEIALIPDEFRKDVLGEIEDDNGVIFEDSDVLAKNIALMYQFKGDEKSIRHIDYNVSVARPSVESGTKTTSLDPKTEAINIVASAATDSGYVKARVLEGQTPYETFFDSVYTYVEPA